jgi:hypothetical protein
MTPEHERLLLYTMVAGMILFWLYLAVTWG